MNQGHDEDLFSTDSCLSRRALSSCDSMRSQLHSAILKLVAKLGSTKLTHMTDQQGHILYQFFFFLEFQLVQFTSHLLASLNEVNT